MWETSSVLLSPFICSFSCFSVDSSSVRTSSRAEARRMPTCAPLWQSPFRRRCLSVTIVKSVKRASSIAASRALAPSTLTHRSPAGCAKGRPLRTEVLSHSKVGLRVRCTAIQSAICSVLRLGTILARFLNGGGGSILNCVLGELVEEIFTQRGIASSKRNTCSTSNCACRCGLFCRLRIGLLMV